MKKMMEEEICEWFQDFWLDEYQEIIKQEKITGETLVFELLENNGKDLINGLGFSKDVIKLQDQFKNRLNKTEIRHDTMVYIM